jgi:hypothetical protein
MPIAHIAGQRLRGVPLSAVANLALQRAILDREQLFLRAKGRPELSQHSMQQRSAIDGLDAETHARHRFGTQPDLSLRSEWAARLQFHRARATARFAQRQRRRTIVSHRVQGWTLVEQHTTQ